MNAILSFTCVDRLASGDRCLGTLGQAGDGLHCAVCGRDYEVVSGVPVLKRPSEDGSAEDWFDEMYQGRDRATDLASPYLTAERRFMADFAARRALVGPCLEVGCGTGMFAEIMPGYVGMEYTLPPLLVPGFDSFRRVCADARWLPFANDSLQCAFSFNTLEHVPSVDLAFAELDRVVRPGGFLVLRPAWHCTRYVTELVHVKPYAGLTARQKLVKAALPVIRSKPYKMATWLPGRLWRHLTAGRNSTLRYGTLTPYHGADWVADADAVASIDCHEGIRYFTSRGYRCHSHPTAMSQLMAGHDIVVLEKPGLPA